MIEIENPVVGFLVTHRYSWPARPFYIRKFVAMKRIKEKRARETGYAIVAKPLSNEDGGR
ncbi:MAG: hypothetical protein JO288_07840 [Hyphomicrobiales bacterium]|nr:hypothetical protein [Hyphomicrobiales bacterium]